VEGYVKEDQILLQAQQTLNNDEVSGAADRQEFRQPLGGSQ
jgi:hypothetical protein